MLAQFGTRSIDMFPILEEFLKNNLREPRFSLKKNMVKFFKYKKIYYEVKLHINILRVTKNM